MQAVIFKLRPEDNRDSKPCHAKGRRKCLLCKASPQDYNSANPVYDIVCYLFIIAFQFSVAHYLGYFNTRGDKMISRVTGATASASCIALADPPIFTRRKVCNIHRDT